MESYVVRIYRRGDGVTASFAGVVQDPLHETETAFRSIEELQRILLGGDSASHVAHADQD
jgi:hypothetical protein